MVTKVQQRSSGPHRGGIAFARGSLFHLLKNPIYRGGIVHKGKVYDGEHEPIVDAGLWERVQAQLAEKAPPRKRPTNEPQRAMLRGLLTDAHHRPMVPTYGSSRTKRYAYYETRKDLARPADPPGIRFQRAQLEQHIIMHLRALLNDEHALRRLSGIEEAGILQTMFATARLSSIHLPEIGKCEQVLRNLIAAISMRSDGILLALRPAALGVEQEHAWNWAIPLPARKPYREARLRIAADAEQANLSHDLLALITDAMAARQLVLGSPALSLAQLAKREGRCRTQLTRLLRLSFLSPKIIEAIVDGTQPARLTRRLMLSCNLPIDWAEQESVLGLAA